MLSSKWQEISKKTALHFCNCRPFVWGCVWERDAAARCGIYVVLLCLCTSSVNVDQWAHQFTLWTNLHEHEVVK
jgi:hypothetical protein